MHGPQTAETAHDADDVEEVTAEPVLDGEAPALAPQPAADQEVVASPGVGRLAVQAAAVAATGLVAGAATTALVRAAKGRGVARRNGRRRRDGAEVLETRTYVVDVHLVARR